MRYTTPLREIKGVGPKLSLQLESAGLKTVMDLVQFLPRAYEDYTKVMRIMDLQPGKVVVQGKITAVQSQYVRRGLHITKAVLEDNSGKVPLVWFNQPYRASHLKDDREWVVAGEFTFSNRRYQLMNPSLRASDEIIESGEAIIPIYRQVAGIKTAKLRSLIEEIRPLIIMYPELLPDSFIKKGQFMSYAEALTALHFPEDMAQIEQARKRVAFQELVELLLAAELNKSDNAALESWQIPFDKAGTKQFIMGLPFALTGDQRRAAWDIIQNFEAGEPMNRLLQGDVGSGKTIVAGIGAYMAARAGYQTALLAPTELLARQHAETLVRLLEPHHVSVGLLIGSMNKKSKEELKTHIADGSIAITVGTHALIQDTVRFHKLGFVVIDEQHRFGVIQRQKILQKSLRRDNSATEGLDSPKHVMPHLLAMTATPIPRSLQLTMYGELEISILQEKPAGRKEIKTRVVSPISRAGLVADVDKEIAIGRQVYVVCPLIEDDVSEIKQASQMQNSRDVKSVTAEYERLKKTAFRHRRIGLLHGKMKAEEKETIMRQFAAHELDILVSTTVVEVGVDVPNATVMIIEGAERYGLAQLHQLRGRVGRSDHQSYCYLVPTEAKQTASQRLKEVAKSSDGFYLAEKDLEMRGPGEIYGRMQSGQINLQIANLADTKSILAVKRAIAWARDNGVNLLQYEAMKRRVDTYRRLTTLN